MATPTSPFFPEAAVTKAIVVLCVIAITQKLREIVTWDINRKYLKKKMSEFCIPLMERHRNEDLGHTEKNCGTEHFQNVLKIEKKDEHLFGNCRDLTATRFSDLMFPNVSMRGKDGKRLRINVMLRAGNPHGYKPHIRNSLLGILFRFCEKDIDDKSVEKKLKIHVFDLRHSTEKKHDREKELDATHVKLTCGDRIGEQEITVDKNVEVVTESFSLFPNIFFCSQFSYISTIWRLFSVFIESSCKKAEVKKLGNELMFGFLRDNGGQRLLYLLFLECEKKTFGKLLRRIVEVLEEDDKKEWKTNKILFHCTAGKDRTGLVSALVLHSLGVDQPTIIDQYEMSTYLVNKETLVTDVEKAVPWLKGSDILREIALATPPLVLKDTLRYVENEYGSVDKYLDDIGFTEKWRTRLQEKMLV